MSKALKILELQEILRDLPQVECPIVHRFAPHCYLREIFMPAGSVVVGKIHATEHFNIILKGKCTVATKDGIETFEGPFTFVSPENTQKVVLMHTDVIWQTVHVTDETNIDKIEEEIIQEPDPLLLEAITKKLEVLL